MATATVRTVVIVALVLVPCLALAIVLGGSNLGLFGYPSHSCSKPQKPHKPFQFTDQWELDRYNAEVRRYNSELELYFSCINEYIDNSKNDIRRIQEKMQEAIRDAKS